MSSESLMQPLMMMPCRSRHRAPHAPWDAPRKPADASCLLASCKQQHAGPVLLLRLSGGASVATRSPGQQLRAWHGMTRAAASHSHASHSTHSCGPSQQCCRPAGRSAWSRRRPPPAPCTMRTQGSKRTAAAIRAEPRWRGEGGRALPTSCTHQGDAVESSRGRHRQGRPGGRYCVGGCSAAMSLPTIAAGKYAKARLRPRTCHSPSPPAPS